MIFTVLVTTFFVEREREREREREMKGYNIVTGVN